MKRRYVLVSGLLLATAACSAPDVPASTVAPDPNPVATQAEDDGTIEPDAEGSIEEISGEPEVCAAVLTPSNPEGPFYSPGAPERTSLVEPGSSGTPILLKGTVVNLDCEPIPGALLDFWQTDAFGEYDNEGFRFRGKLFADEEGKYELETILPGLYPGRPAHIHVKVTPPGGTEHTTQIYFPGTQFGGAGQFVDAALIVTLSEATGGNMIASFDFVLNP